MLPIRTWTLAGAVLAAVVTTGCDSSATGRAADASDAPAAPPWTGGAAADAAKLLGVWVAGERRLDDDDEKSARMQQAIADRTMRFDFRDGGCVLIQLGGDCETEEGRWRVVGSDGAALVVRIESPSCSAQEFRLAFLDDNRVTMSQVNEAGLAFTLTRLRSES